MRYSQQYSVRPATHTNSTTSVCRFNWSAVICRFVVGSSTLLSGCACGSCPPTMQQQAATQSHCAHLRYVGEIRLNMCIAHVRLTRLCPLVELVQKRAATSQNTLALRPPVSCCQTAQHVRRRRRFWRHKPRGKKLALAGLCTIQRGLGNTSQETPVVRQGPPCSPTAQRCFLLRIFERSSMLGGPCVSQRDARVHTQDVRTMFATRTVF